MRRRLAFVAAVAALVLAPLASLLLIALRGDTDIWGHLAAYVLPVALKDTALLLAGVAAITAVIGIGAAWLVTAYRFPGRAMLVWLLPLPLAIPTYIVAYVYVDVLDTLGPVQVRVARPVRLDLAVAVLVPETCARSAAQSSSWASCFTPMSISRRARCFRPRAPA